VVTLDTWWAMRARAQMIVGMRCSKKMGEPTPNGRGIPVGWLEWPNAQMAEVKRQLGKALALRVTRKACRRSVERVLHGLCAVQASQVSRLVSTGVTTATPAGLVVMCQQRQM
jgi:hypothetical protein